ncbi:glycoside hydrolase family 76 protein [Occallatibacter riparius]|uniref:Glycoside hydrolase family 76 protein n=1 Tax=Occallatibacter riparius TaxID=1002689 RepID=A0A9J7BVL9_9BACT|nr:glycoside hydrolase family 76 protein [Occallatibacter riparius]UWZ85834.1 glycoside hydrolase family 76 protein [Occallatibacter riparius]
MKLKARQVAFALGASWLFTGCGGSAATSPTSGPAPAPTTQLSRAAAGIATLQTWYNSASGLYDTAGWWNSANAITVLVDYARVSKSGQYDTVFSNTFHAAQKTSAGFLNNFYDDEGWWALAWIDAYDLTGNKQYLAMAESIFADMSRGWDGTCGGGIWWSKDRGYKNAIANELFLSVAAHLANRDNVNSAQFLGWANKEWTWFAQSGMINGTGLINDGLGTSSGHTVAGSCANNGQATWSYNQGVVLGGLTELAKLNSDAFIPRAAQKIAIAAITHLVDNQGMLHDPCEPKCGADGVQFKGIFVRNLLALNAAAPQTSYKTFITTNANAIWQQSQGPGYKFGQVWSGPFDVGNAASQSSALDAIVGAAVLENGK